MVLLAGQCATAQVAITEVMSSSELTEDWFEITNFGSSAVDLTGYFWDDDGPTGNDGALFGNVSIDAGESIVLYRDDDSTALIEEWTIGDAIQVLNETDFSGNDLFSVCRPMVTRSNCGTQTLMPGDRLILCQQSRLARRQPESALSLISLEIHLV
jgi:hypothetical protein